MNMNQIRMAYQYNKRKFIIFAAFDVTMIVAVVYFGLHFYEVI